MIRSKEISGFRTIYWAEAVKRLVAIEVTEAVSITHEYARELLTQVYYMAGKDIFEGYPVTQALFLEKVDTFTGTLIIDWEDEQSLSLERKLREVYMAIEQMEVM